MTNRRVQESSNKTVPMPGTEQILGRHILIDMYGCSQEALNDVEALQACLLRAAAVLETQVLNVYGHRFTPQGATVIVAVSESHLAIHTWPEYGYAAIDFFLCGRLDRPVQAAIALVVDLLQPQRCSVQPFDRGVLKECALAASH